MYSLDSYTYYLPDELIAQEAVHPQHDARLMIVDRTSGTLESEDIFWNLDTYIPEDRIIFFNDSRVLPARIRLENTKIQNKEGGEGIIKKGEILFCQKQVDGTFEALVRPGNKFKVGTKIFIEWWYIEVIAQSHDGRILKAHGITIEEIMKNSWELPLPPYIAYDKGKEEDYQTIFAKKDGSVAAPTASLHFTPELLAKLPEEKIAITLHVGLWTFQGVDTEDIREYKIHKEMAEIDIALFTKIATEKQGGKRILAVGTTVCRTLESLPYLWHALEREIREWFAKNVQDFWENFPKEIGIIGHIESRGTTIFFETSIFLYPGKNIHIVDDLITNFHLPESSLLMLVSTFLGRENTLKLYEYAREKRYRFFSFGDGMYIRDISR
jgi:S-adenosylmethionine:tRNA ribosyltransferase-isomerase